MERLVFFEDELLSHAFEKKAEWDVSNVDMSTALPSVRSWTQAAAALDDCGDNGMANHFK